MIRILLNHALSDTENIPPLLPLVTQNEYVAQVLLCGTVYVQFFSLAALFRPPRLQSSKSRSILQQPILADLSPSTVAPHSPLISEQRIPVAGDHPDFLMPLKPMSGA